MKDDKRLNDVFQHPSPTALGPPLPSAVSAGLFYWQEKQGNRIFHNVCLCVGIHQFECTGVSDEFTRESSPPPFQVLSFVCECVCTRTRKVKGVREGQTSAGFISIRGFFLSSIFRFLLLLLFLTAFLTTGYSSPRRYHPSIIHCAPFHLFTTLCLTLNSLNSTYSFILSAISLALSLSIPVHCHF